MATIEDGLYQLGRIDRLAAQDTPVHRLDPRVKVVTTLVFLVCVASFGKYEVLPMVPFALFPIALASAGDLPFDYLGTRLLIAAPFAVVVAMFNPLLDHTVIAQFGAFGVTGGWVSFASIVLRFLLTAAAALVLVATTGMMGVSMAIERLGAPDVFATQLLFLYRYIFVLGEEAMRMTRARALRSFGDRGMGIQVYGQMLGHLLLRTYARARRVYQAMLCRGFDGHVRTVGRLRITRRDVVFALGWTTAFLVFRFVDVPQLIGRLVLGGL